MKVGLISATLRVKQSGTGVETASTSAQMIISSSGLLIAVGTVLDTMKQLEAQLRMRHYEWFIK